MVINLSLCQRFKLTVKDDETLTTLSADDYLYRLPLGRSETGKPTSGCHVVHMPQHRDCTVTPHKQLQQLVIYIWDLA